MKQIVYWDSDAFLALLNQDKQLHLLQACKATWNAANRGLIHIVTSTLTTAEVIYIKGAPKLDPRHRQEVSNFFRQPFMSQKPLTREIAELARDVVWDSNIKPKDAIHVATCAYFKIRELHSFDENLVKKGHIIVNGFTLFACYPSTPAQSELDIE